MDQQNRLEGTWEKGGKLVMNTDHRGTDMDKTADLMRFKKKVDCVKR